MKSTPSQDGSGQLEPSELIDGFLTWETLRAVRQDRRFDPFGQLVDDEDPMFSQSF